MCKEFTKIMLQHSFLQAGRRNMTQGSERKGTLLAWLQKPGILAQLLSISLLSSLGT